LSLSTQRDGCGSCCPLSIRPLPQFEADLEASLKEKEDREAYEKLNAPSSIVVRFGFLRMVGEFPYSGDAKPGCGSKLVVRTHRGIELGEMLTSTCKNSGCAKSVTRKEMLQYIENSGGRQYPFYDQGRVVRIATVDDLNNQHKLEQRKNEIRLIAKGMVEEAGLAMTVIEAEPILGNERVVIYFGAEDRIDFRDLVQGLSRRIGTKVELRQIGARDEARITADYERCGQYCCCKGFLKVLKPVSMKSAKVQKATLDPLKISGRCGRLMCCLRYEDETYDELRKNLPHRKSRVGTPEGDGIVISTQILTQLALVRLDNNTDVAIPVEDLTDPEFKTMPEPGTRSGGRSGGRAAKSKRGDEQGGEVRSGKRVRSKSAKSASAQSESAAEVRGGGSGDGAGGGAGTVGDRPKKKRRRRRRSGSSAGEGAASSSLTESSPSSAGPSPSTSSSGEGSGGGGPKKKRKRRRRRRSTGEGGSGSGSDSGSGGSGDSGGGDS